MSFKTSHPVLTSPDGLYIIAVSDGHLIVRLSRATVDETPIRTIFIGVDFAGRLRFIRWASNRSQSQDYPNPPQYRILLADDHTIRIWDIIDTQWNTKIENAGGTSGKIAQVDFGLDANEVFVFSEFGVKVSIWLLDTGKCIEIKDPRFSNCRGYGYRPRTGHLALLTRPNAFDTLTMHAPRSYEAISSFTIPTVDAQGLKWSPDGHWIAVWDSAAAGCKVMIYTADGQLFRTYSGDEEDEMAGLGVKALEWSPGSNYLAISGFNNRVTLLSARTFSAIVGFDHTSTISLPSLPVYHEQVSASNEHVYILASQPAYPPTTISSPNEANPKTGVSTISFNASGTMMVTRNDSMPTSVWIWSITSLKPVAVLIQHSHVKTLAWHPSDSNLLLVTCSMETPLVYQWSQDWELPRIAFAPVGSNSSKSSIRWLPTEEPDQTLLLATSLTSYTVGFVEHRDEASQSHFVTIADGKDRNDSPVKGTQSPRKDVTELFDESTISKRGQDIDSSNENGLMEDMDDTFHYRRNGPVAG